MKYCVRCFYHENHPLNLTFGDDGLCSGCSIHEEKDQIDWSKKLIKLKKIIKPYLNSKRSINNCIISVSGSRDSYYIVHFVKKILGLNPLLVNYNIQYNTDVGIRNASYLKTLLGCPMLTLTISPDKIKKITRYTMEKLGSIYWHCIAGQTVLPVQVANKFRIPLIIWGCHQGIDQVGMFSHHQEVEMTRKYRKEHDLMGYEAEDFLDDKILSFDDIYQFIYPSDSQIGNVGIRGIYLNNYIRWDTKQQQELMIKTYNYETANLQRTFDRYSNVDCFHYSGLHDYIKYLKHGYSLVNDHATRELRLNRISREEGINLINRYSQIYPNDIKIFSDWLGSSEKKIKIFLDSIRNKKYWKKNNDNWVLRYPIEKAELDKKKLKEFSLKVKEKLDYNSGIKKNSNEHNNKYNLLGTGWAV